MTKIDRATLSEIEREKINQAVTFINETTVLSGLDLAKKIGKYVLTNFFDDDYAKFADPSRSKALSFRALLERHDLILGRSTVYNFVRVSHQLEYFSEEIACRLTLSHHRALLALPNPKDKEDLAREALEKGWTSLELSSVVKEKLPKSRAGRKPLSPMVKWIRQLQRTLDRVFVESGEGLLAEDLDQDMICSLSEQIEQSIEVLRNVQSSLAGSANPDRSKEIAARG